MTYSGRIVRLRSVRHVQHLALQSKLKRISDISVVTALSFDLTKHLWYRRIGMWFVSDKGELIVGFFYVFYRGS